MYLLFRQNVVRQKYKRQVINIGPDENYITINELYEILSNKLQFNMPAKYYEDRPNEVKIATVHQIKQENY